MRRRDLLKAAVEDFGKIVGVAIDSERSSALSKVLLTLEHGTLLIEAIPDDDTITVSEGIERPASLKDVEDVQPWSRLIGLQPIWMWTLENQQGYVDGFQVIGRTQVGRFGIQLVTVASALKASLVVPT